MTLTTKKLESLYNKVRKEEATFTDRDGLSCRVSPKGKVTYQYRFRWLGTPARMKVGSYPAMSLDEARQEVISYRRNLDEGKDPRQQKKLKILENQQINSLKQGLTMWLEQYAKYKRSDYEALSSTFQRYVYPLIGDVPINELSLDYWNIVFENPKLKRYPVACSSLLTNLKSAMRYLAKKRYGENLSLEILSANDVGAKAKKGERYLLNHELSVLWRYVSFDDTLELPNDNYKVSRRNLLVTRLIMGFGSRTKELRVSKKKDFDLKNGIWVVKKSKSGNTIIRPIHEALIPVLEELINMFPETSILIPPLDNVDSKVPVSGSSLSGIPDTLNNRLNFDHWTMHDLRRTIDTHMIKLKIDLHVAEKVLGHVLGGVMEVYNKHDYLDEQLEAYEVWINHLNSLALESRNSEE